MQRQVSGSTKPGDVSKLVFAKSGWECERSAKALKISERVPPGPPGSEMIYLGTEMWSVHTAQKIHKIFNSSFTNPEHIVSLPPAQPALHEFILATKSPIALDSLEPTESLGAKACHSPATSGFMTLVPQQRKAENLDQLRIFTSPLSLQHPVLPFCAVLAHFEPAVGCSTGPHVETSRNIAHPKEHMVQTGASPSALRLLLPVDRGHQQPGVS